jgi:hypothetical protein
MPKPSMTQAEREVFLNQPLVAVISIPEPGRGPLTVPVWFYYEPAGDVCIWTGSNSRKGQLLRNATRISICIQEPNPPYKYISIEGPISIEPAQFERDVRPMALRYFGLDVGEEYLTSIGGSAGVVGDILVRLHPERWLTVDYSKLGPLPT